MTVGRADNPILGHGFLIVVQRARHFLIHTPQVTGPAVGSEIVRPASFNTSSICPWL